MKEALEISRLVLGSQHPSVAESLHNLGAAVLQQVRLEFVSATFVDFPSFFSSGEHDGSN